MEATNRASVDAVTAAHTWSVHPLRHAPVQRSAMLLGLIAGASGLAAATMGGPGYGLLSLVVLLGATARYLLPTRYRVDATGAAAHLVTWRQQPWSLIRRVDRHADGLFLSPFVRPSRLDTFRGIFLPFGGGVDSAALTAYVESRVAA